MRFAEKQHAVAEKEAAKLRKREAKLADKQKALEAKLAKATLKIVAKAAKTSRFPNSLRKEKRNLALNNQVSYCNYYDSICSIKLDHLTSHTGCR